MSVAVCLFGFLRTFEKTAPILLERFVTPHHCDVFIHTWNHTGTGQHFDQSTPVIDAIITRASNLYLAKKFVVDSIDIQDFHVKKPFDASDTSNSIRDRFRYDLMDMYSLKRSNQLKLEYETNNNKRYDHTVYIRPDIYLTHTYPCEWPSNEIWFPTNHSFFDGLGTVYSVGQSDQMNIYAELFDETQSNPELSPILRGESFLKAHLNKRQVKYSKRRMGHGIMQMDGNYIQQILET